MKNKKNVWIIIGILIISAVFFSFYFDNLLIKGVSLLRNDILDNFFLLVTFVSSEVITFFILTSLFLWKEHKRKWIIPLWVSLGISAIVSFILKITIQRDRPFQIGLVPLISKLQEASFSVWNFSFPSSHSILAFCAVPILSQKYPKLKKVWIAFAVLVAFSRIYFGLHFVSDVIVGGLLGYIIGVIVVKLEKEYRFGEKIYGKITGK
jgi:undecaprenyl-diphosphatase